VAAKKRFILIGSIVCLVLFVIISSLVLNNGFVVLFDHTVNQMTSSAQTPLGTSIMVLVSFFASTIFVGLFSAALLTYFYSKKQKPEICSYLKTVFLGVIIGFVIKNIVQRARPENFLETDYSFPSLHATASILLYGWLSFHFWKQGRRRKAVALLCVPLLIGFSRLYLGVHWFSDVLGGLLLGGGWLLGIQYWNKCNVMKSPATVKVSK